MRWLIAFSVLTGACYGMQERSVYVVSRKCCQQIEQVNHDIPRLYWFVVGCFHEVARMRPYVTLSYVLRNIVAGQPSEKMNLQYADPSFYVDTFLQPWFADMDVVLQHKSKERKNRYLAWTSLSGTYLQSILKIEATKHKNELVKSDSCLRFDYKPL